MEVFIPLTKFDNEQRMVYGYASTEALDSHGEKVTKAAVEEALPEYMRFANIREMHQLSAVGVAKEVELDDKGLYVCAKVVDDSAWNKVKEGVYKGFSLGGKKLENIDGTVSKIRLSEISLVDRPANPECRFDIWKAEAGGQPVESLNRETVEPEPEPGAEPDAPLEKAGSRHSSVDLDHIQKIHDHTVALGAGCSSGMEKADGEPAEPLNRETVEPKEESGAEMQETLAKMEATLSKTEEILAKIQAENAELKDRLEKLEAQPEPPKAALKDLTAFAPTKEQDAEDLSKTEETEPTDTLSLIKAAHRRPLSFDPRSHTKEH